VDIVDSTRNTIEISDPDKIRDYYSVFLNTMATIIRNHTGRVVKNSGDSLLYYFPRTIDPNNDMAFQQVIDCGLAMIEINKELNRYYSNRGLSSISYRISANYGRVELAMSSNSNNVDLFGSTVNICSKINQLAGSNQMVVHGDLHRVLQNNAYYSQYKFKDQNNYQRYDNTANNYIIYSVERIEAKTKDQAITKQQQSMDLRDRDNTTLNILIIDDDEDILFTFKAIIQNEGYNVNIYSNPIEALTHFSQINPYFYHLVIMDIRMPGLNGIKLYSKIKVINPDIKVLILSALNALEEVLCIFPEIKHGEILRKPIEPDMLLTKIRAILHND